MKTLALCCALGLLGGSMLLTTSCASADAETVAGELAALVLFLRNDRRPGWSVPFVPRLSSTLLPNTSNPGGWKSGVLISGKLPRTVPPSFATSFTRQLTRPSSPLQVTCVPGAYCTITCTCLVDL